MKRSELIKAYDALAKKMRDTMVAKNQDYAGNASDDAFFNFTRIEALGLTTTEVGMLTRMMDKISRLVTFTQSEELAVKDESITDTAQDLAVYSMLLAIYLQSKYGYKAKK